MSGTKISAEDQIEASKSFCEGCLNQMFPVHMIEEREETYLLR